MAPDRPLITAALAFAVLLGLLLMATRPPGLLTADSAQSTDELSGSEQEEALPPAEGGPGGQTVVDPGAVAGLQEEKLSYDGPVDTSVTYPVLPNADPLTEYLERELSAEVAAFEDADHGADSYEADWNLTAARQGLVGVRIAATESGSGGERERFSTYWYDTEQGQVYGSTHLFDDQEALTALDTLAREEVGEDADTSGMYPISALYDSIGFGPDGDLVVEFDAGQVAPAAQDRMHAVLDHSEIEPLLSDLGTRAHEAATVGVDTFEIAEAPDTAGDDPLGTAPGTISPDDDSVDCTDTETTCVALTFDDGPGGGTPQLLDTLDEHDARATFFVTGHPVQEHPETLRRAYAEGHEIANHTLNHPDLTSIGAGDATMDLSSTQALVLRETGYEMDLMRPPYGATDGGVATVTQDMGLAQILWSVDTNDWRHRDADKVADTALDGADDGAIILMHDIHSTTITAAEEIVRELESSGVEMVTVTQLLGSTEPGESYMDGVPDPEEGDEENADEGADASDG
ncbi:polysaccharide deacetylase family protein [Nocardiopsis xinjiangensis]|uniref:polysaccharide deacetylase family protein n=1 Tax=Nocardiopsis xinjiangensis TaxID=124285 RepID=UPI00052763AA|nr:polysaccharide deacetylase family protein [Nocardiopsis xinjiangensis]